MKDHHLDSLNRCHEHFLTLGCIRHHNFFFSSIPKANIMHDLPLRFAKSSKAAPPKLWNNSNDPIFQVLSAWPHHFRLMAAWFMSTSTYNCLFRSRGPSTGAGRSHRSSLVQSFLYCLMWNKLVYQHHFLLLLFMYFYTLPCFDWQFLLACFINFVFNYVYRYTLFLLFLLMSA